MLVAHGVDRGLAGEEEGVGVGFFGVDDGVEDEGEDEEGEEGGEEAPVGEEGGELGVEAFG